MQTCKERWKNIRTVFLRHLRKKPPSGSAGGIKKKYYLADALHFLIPFVKTSRKQKGNLNLDCELNQSIADSDDDDAGSKVQESQEIDPEVQVTNTQPQLDETESPEPPRVSQSIHNRFTAIKTKNKQTDAEKSLVEYFEAKKARLDKPSESADEKFLLSLLPDINLMNAHQKRRLKREILELIDKILLEDNSSDSGKSFGPPSVGSLSRSDTQYRPPSSFSYRSASDTQSTTINVSHVSDTQSPTVLSVPPLSPCNSDGYLYHTFA